MYTDSRFEERDPAEIRAFVEANPLATVVALGPDGRYGATHIPLLIEEWGARITLRGHLMRDSDHGPLLTRVPAVFVSFLGPDAPVLGSWQSSRDFGGTWNYQAVHLQGRVRVLDRETLLAHLEQLKNRFETDPDYRYARLPEGYVPGLLPGIIGVEIEADEVKALFKLSQNRLPEEYDRTARELARQGGKAALVAAEMERPAGALFSVIHQRPGSAGAAG